MTLATLDTNGRSVVGRRAVPALVVRAQRIPAGFPPAMVSAQTAAQLGLRAADRAIIFDTTRMPTEHEQQAAQAALDRLGVQQSLYVERGYQGGIGLGLLALVAGAAVITFGATAVATGLAAAEGRGDLAILAAVGASPRLRRVLAMAQAGTVAVLGAGLGVLAGLVPAIAVIKARQDFPLAIPWSTLGATLVVVPLLAALAAGVFTRSRLPVERRPA